MLKKIPEYVLNGDKYVPFEVGEKMMFVDDSNRIIPIGTRIWIKVEPVEWYYDEEKQLLISAKLLYAGVMFNKEKILFKHKTLTESSTEDGSDIVKPKKEKSRMKNKMKKMLEGILKKIREIKSRIMSSGNELLPGEPPKELESGRPKWQLYRLEKTGLEQAIDMFPETTAYWFLNNCFRTRIRTI